jgi:hypothetical protein
MDGDGRKVIMKDRDKVRFHDNITWFNQFFDGIRQIYELTVDLVPTEYFHEDFTLSSDNFYFPRYKAAPSLPPYYALILEGKKVSFQILSVLEASLIAQSGSFIVEPSMIIVIHSQVDKFAWINEFALKVIKSQDVELTKMMDDVIWGKINGKFPADFFAFQVRYDKFSDDKNPQASVSKYIVDPIIENLERGF